MKEQHSSPSKQGTKILDVVATLESGMKIVTEVKRKKPNAFFNNTKT